MTKLGLSIFILTLLVAFVTPQENWSGSVADRCFCKLKGEVDDCSCKVESVDSFNNKKIHPILNSLLHKDYFRYFKVNLNKGCPFWSDEWACSSKNCHVNFCKEDQLPEGFKGNGKNGNGDHAKQKYTKEANTEGSCRTEEEDELGSLNRTISVESKEAFQVWKQHDDASNTFCEVDDENSVGMEYVDLLLNPERYTGYKGGPAHKIWNAIYQENCFQPEKMYGFLSQKSITGKAYEDMCLEKRAFYRMVSGLHTSINIHLSALFLLPSKSAYGSATFGPNPEEFKSRFDPELSAGEGPQRLKNLYFTYLVELRALAKAAPYLSEESFYTDNEEEDADTMNAVKNLLEVAKSFPDHFDESKLFQDPTQSAELQEAFRNHFHNISKIMDCVHCDKCRLWGKLQVTGMGTALKILFSGDSMGPKSTVQPTDKSHFQLRRSEIVALFNAFGRLSASIHYLEMFRDMIKDGNV